MPGSSEVSSAIVESPATAKPAVNASTNAASVVETGSVEDSSRQDESRQLGPNQLRAALTNFLPKGATPAEQIAAIEAALRSPMGQAMRDTMAKWIVDAIVPVTRLVPKAYENWRPPVRDAMMFVVAHLSPARLAPKISGAARASTEHHSRAAPAAADREGSRPAKTGTSHRPQSTSPSRAAQRASPPGKRNS